MASSILPPSMSALDSFSQTLDISAFGGRCDGSDTTPALRAALDDCARRRPSRLLFPKGRYEFWPERALEIYSFVSNNDEGLRRVAFALLGIQDLEIDGQGSEFIFHGYLNPFLLRGARNIRLRNFSIDFARSFHSEAVILEKSSTGLDVEISDKCPFEVRNGILFFNGSREGTANHTTVKGKEAEYPYGYLLEFDARKRETAYKVRDHYVRGGVAVQPLTDRRVRLLMPELEATPGNILVFGASHRLAPAFVISDSTRVQLEEIVIHHCGGIGVIAQRSADLTLDHLRVTPREGRMISATADATHFVNCTGKITLSDCLFENQMDDATNIHGIYGRISAWPAADEIEVQLVHPQQFGFDFIAPEDHLEIVHSASLMPYGKARVVNLQRLNKEFTRVFLSEPLPPETRLGDALAVITEPSEVTIRDCIIRNNRARGLLLNCRGRTLIERNHFHTPGAAILFEGDARFWYEEGGVRDCTIRNNWFDNCNFGVWGRATIETAAGVEEEYRPRSRYNRNIAIENNRFNLFERHPIVAAYCVDGLAICDNEIEFTKAYPSEKLDGKLFDLSECDHVIIENNGAPCPPQVKNSNVANGAPARSLNPDKPGI